MRSDTLFIQWEFGFDIDSKDSKTTAYHKVAARIICVLTKVLTEHEA